MKGKYIKTEEGDIIIFREAIPHTDFKHFKPVSAGFISIVPTPEGTVTMECHGESVGLGLKSDPEDTTIANKQFQQFY